MPSRELVVRLELGTLAGDEPEHHGLVGRHVAQRREVAGPLVVVLEEVGVDVELVEQHLGDGLVAALREPRAAVVAAAQVDGDGEVVGTAGDGGVDQLGVGVRERVGVVATLDGALLASPDRTGRRGWCRRAVCTGSRPRTGRRSRRGTPPPDRRRTPRDRGRSRCRSPPGRHGSAPSSATGSRPSASGWPPMRGTGSRRPGCRACGAAARPPTASAV